MSVRDVIEAQYPVLDHTECVANISILKKEVNPENGIVVKGAFSNRNDSLRLVFDTEHESVITFKKGDAFPDANLLEELKIEIPRGTSVIPVKFLASRKNADESLLIDFNDSYKGTIYAVAEWIYKD